MGAAERNGTAYDWGLWLKWGALAGAFPAGTRLQARFPKQPPGGLSTRRAVPYPVRPNFFSSSRQLISMSVGRPCGHV